MDDPVERITSYLVVYVGSGACLALVADAAAVRLGAFSTFAVFLAGWVAQMIFHGAMERLTADNAN